jgi:hypothetical protein
MLEVVDENWHPAVSDNEDSILMPNVKNIELTIERIREALSYDPETGKIFWKICASRRIRPGDEAGIVKVVHTTVSDRMYRYITLDGQTTPAARFAWALHYGEWPQASVKYVDDNSENLKIENLQLARFPSEVVKKGDLRRYKMSKEASRHYGLKRYYGITGEDYGRMLADQRGVCAICNEPETAVTPNGTPKVMHVDHDHETGGVRALLCGNCNAMLGHAKDSPATLRAAADYIERHAAKVVSIGARRAGASDGET